MATRVEAIYEDGALHPVEPLALAEHERVTITIEPDGDLDDLIDHEFMSQCREEVAPMNYIPTLEETQELLRSVPGSFADEIVRARGDR
jgi:predicted DNA-binding antitoxin AbrB/MazE fold protein